MRTAIERVTALIAGKGPARIKLSRKDVDPYRDALAELIKGTAVGYSHDPFLDIWLITRAEEEAPAGHIKF